MLLPLQCLCESKKYDITASRFTAAAEEEKTTLFRNLKNIWTETLKTAKYFSHPQISKGIIIFLIERMKSEKTAVKICAFLTGYLVLNLVIQSSS